jgi:hypothetical protein
MSLDWASRRVAHRSTPSKCTPLNCRVPTLRFSKGAGLDVASPRADGPPPFRDRSPFPSQMAVLDARRHRILPTTREARRWLVGAVGIEPTTSSMPWKRAPSCATDPRLTTKSPRPPNRDRGKYRIHFRRWHSTPTRHFTSQVPRLGFQQRP